MTKYSKTYSVCISYLYWCKHCGPPKKIFYYLFYFSSFYFFSFISAQKKKSISVRPYLRQTLFYVFPRTIKSKRMLTLHVEHHAVGEPLVAVRDDARQLLLVRLPAGHDHVVAAHRHRPVLVAGFLEGGLALQPGVPPDHAGRLAVGRHARGHRHLAALRAGHDGGRGQGHASQGASCGKGVSGGFSTKRFREMLMK